MKTMRFTSNIVGIVYLAADIICFLLAAPLALAGYVVLSDFDAVQPVLSLHILSFLLVLGSFLLIRASRHAYRRTLLEPFEGQGEAVFDAVISSLIAAALIWQAGFIESYSRGLAILYLLSVVVLLLISQPILVRVFNSLARSGRIAQKIVIYGATPATASVLQELVSSLPHRHLRFVGIADDRSTHDNLGGFPIVGDLRSVCDAARRGEVDQVLICGGHLSVQRIQQIAHELSSVSVDVSLIPDYALSLLPNYRVNLLGKIPVLTLWQRPFRDTSQILKRAEDLVLGSAAVILLAPLLLIAALLVRITSAGPILFVQPRIGFNNEIINVFKFRTMYVDSTDIGAVRTTVRNDPRVTPVGRILRRLSIDELPQLINVLQGNMSLVGPRPHAIEMKIEDLYYHEAVRGYAGRHRVKPGITGLAQVKGLRGELRTIERAKRRVELDQFYVDNWSLLLDVKVLLATVSAVLFDHDAY